MINKIIKRLRFISFFEKSVLFLLFFEDKNINHLQTHF